MVRERVSERESERIKGRIRRKGVAKDTIVIRRERVTRKEL